MDVVKAFNTELSSLYDVKPPISKAKMTSITKGAIKGIKFYKHIVQSVEKFIQKCRPEYKVPGLYVVDSIVRQSRHQFGADKDVFGPRFLKNINATFQQLFKCAEDDRPKIIRVLNLWQKNAVFPIDVIQPLMDMGNPNTTNDPPPVTEESRSSRRKDNESTAWKGWQQGNDDAVSDRPYAEMSTKNLEKFTKAEMTNAIENEVSSSSMFRTKMKQEALLEENIVKFNKKLLDFDYGDEEDEEEAKNDDSHLSNKPNALALSMAQNLLSNPELLRQLQQMQQTIQQSEQAFGSDPSFGQLKQEEGGYSQDGSPTVQQPVHPQNPYGAEPPMMPYQQQAGMSYNQQPPLPMMDPMGMDPNAGYNQAGQLQDKPRDEDERVMYSMPGEPPLPPQDFDERPMQGTLDEGSRSRKDRSRSPTGERNRGRSGRHRSRSRSPKRKRSRSRSPSRRNNSSARSKERERIREKEREREKERDRKRKGLPTIKKNCVSVCTTTLWIGHVPKSCTEMEVNSAFGPFGTIISIYMIPPRGCAYVVMDRRQDAYKALQKLKNTKILQSNSIKMAWAPGKGVKGKEFKDYWEVDAGVSYIPYDKIPEDPSVLDLLEEGGVIDEETLPDNLKALRQQPTDKSVATSANVTAPKDVPFPSMTGAPPMVPAPIIPPTSVNLPMLLHHHPMQPQFGLHLPGLLPPQAMMMQVPMGIPPPNPMLMVQQQSLGTQALPMVGGPMGIPRTVVPSMALQNLKTSHIPEPSVAAGSPMVPANALAGTTGDATPTDEDGTSVSSPASNQKPSGPVPTTSQSMNPMMSMNRPMLPIPPPSSSSGGGSGNQGPIPYPPPNVGPGGYNFPPPGMRPPNSQQFPWMQKSSSGGFPDADHRQGVPPHQPFNRPPMPSSSPMKEPDRRSMDMDRSSSPDKMQQQEMVISTDDESSMDREYDGPPVGNRFPGEFSPRIPMGMHRMRGPMPRFNMPMGGGPRGPWDPRMGGPRGPMGMHPDHRMEEFSSQRGGPRMPQGMPNRFPPPTDGRDWYKRDFDGPFERERPFGRDSGWKTAEDADARQDTRPPRDYDSRGPGGYRNRGPPPRDDDIDDFNVRQRPRPPKKPVSEKDFSNDLLSLRFYQRDKKPEEKEELHRELQRKKAEESSSKKTGTKNESSGNGEKRGQTESQDAINARQEREARKRSRWGRTLSEEREFQEQRKCEIEMKRTEVEMKFQSYEKEQQLLPNPPVSTSENSNSEPTNIVGEDTTNTDVQNNINEPCIVPEPTENPVAQQSESLSTVPDPAFTEAEFPRQQDTSSLSEPVPADRGFRTKPLEEPVSESAPMPHSEVSNSTSLETGSLPRSNINHVNCENIEIPSSQALEEVPCKPSVEDAVFNLLPAVIDNDSHVPENTDAAESCSAPES